MPFSIHNKENQHIERIFEGAKQEEPTHHDNILEAENKQLKTELEAIQNQISASKTD